MKDFRGPWIIRLFGVRLPRWVCRRLSWSQELHSDEEEKLALLARYCERGDLESWDALPNELKTPRVWPTGRSRVCIGRIPVTPWMRELPLVIE